MLNYTNTKSIWFERMLDHQNMATSYKAFWLKSIFLEVIENNGQMISFERLIHRMIAEAWYPIVQFKLNFGVQDQLSNVVKYLETNYAIVSDISKSNLLEWMTHDEKLKCDREFNRMVKGLYQMVPYRLINPFFSESTKGMKDQTKNRMITELASQATDVFYRVYSERRCIQLQEDWITYINKNQAILIGWLNHKLTGYLQNKNLSVPNILSKLEPPISRDLSWAKLYWQDAIVRLKLLDLYTNLPYDLVNIEELGAISIDHFVPWSFVLHDELWNLAPTFKHVNSAKGNRLPRLEESLDLFCELQYRVFLTMRSEHNHKKVMEDYLNLGGSLNNRSILLENEPVDQALFIDSLKRTINPLHQIAFNQGYGIWNGYQFYNANATLAAESVKELDIY
ncbi:MULTISPECIES: HNH endonuclease domain-containing protein [unclassified Fusibacter]|uniref:HNH endonuclease domain-containing protein n=1 Tax=unclassified Fusibacter TaxID=2624464 RepID=UPI0010132F12|nr:MULTISPECIES: HNH endonuclease domain-containing protein [unclassified Fusibacter]MCK8058398.1 hypothetical protein [Fusibacter sp. A2]NPE20980.1 hypothetical protein [Fusibacter sp. A1]RXV63181.1 hypothetical protein DWB64_04030 [Fusibacter sp. A1]